MLTEILIAQAVASAILSAIVAYNKNRHVTGWCLLGALFGVLGLIAVASVGEVQEAHQEEDHENQAEKSESQESEPQESQVQEREAEESQRPAAGGQRETT